MQKPALPIVIIGDVDHGKSTLIGRLLYDTGSLPADKIKEIKEASKNLGKKPELAHLLDCLEEERKKGATIDTTQVFFKINNAEYIIIDAPGHVEFLKNMITGASQAKAAIIIIAADEGIKEQTKRHAAIILLLGIDSVIAAINKMDLVNFSQEKYNGLKEEAITALSRIQIKPLLFIPISALKGDNALKRSKNMPWHKGATISEALNLLQKKSSQRKQTLIFPIQDIYTINKKKIAVGKIESGSLTKGQTLIALPDKKTIKVRSIAKFGKKRHNAGEGESIGIITGGAIEPKRGDILSQTNEYPEITISFRATIFWMSEDSYLKNNALLIHCATQQANCKITKIHRRIDSATMQTLGENAEKINHAEIAEVTIETQNAIAACAFKNIPAIGRFVLTHEKNILSGGIITDIDKNKAG